MSPPEFQKANNIARGRCLGLTSAKTSYSPPLARFHDCSLQDPVTPDHQQKTFTFSFSPNGYEVSRSHRVEEWEKGSKNNRHNARRTPQTQTPLGLTITGKFVTAKEPPEKRLGAAICRPTSHGEQRPKPGGLTDGPQRQPSTFTKQQAVLYDTAWPDTCQRGN